MKKIILSFSLIFTFTAYTLYVRILGANTSVVLTPEPNKLKAPLNLTQYNKTIVKPKSTSFPSSKLISNSNSTPIPITMPNTISSSVINTDKYKNGSYTGSIVDAYYGNVQVLAVVSNGKITDVQFLNYPKSRQTSVNINTRAMPYLISEAITIQDSNVDTVSGASFTSAAFRKSLEMALFQARI